MKAARDIPSGLVGDLLSDIRDAAPLRSFEGRLDPRDLDAAYAVQDALCEALSAQGVRGPVIGYKVALSNAAQMRAFGLTEPCSGQLFADQRHQSPAALRAEDYRSFLLEPEIVALLKAPIEPRGGHDRASVLPSVERFLPGFELLDSRGAVLSELSVGPVVANNITNAGLVVGGPGCAPEALDPATLPTRLEINGTVTADLVGAAPQHPLDVLAWMSGHLAARGRRLEAGMFVLCGTHVPPGRLDSPAEVRVTMGSLGEAAFTLR